MIPVGFWPAAAWSGVAVLAPLAGRHLRRALSLRGAAWADVASAMGPWLHGLGPPFFALFSGAVPARYLGLYGSRGWVGWAFSALLLGGLWYGARTALDRRPLRFDAARYDTVVLDEPRWALYRGAGWLLAGSFHLGALIGLGVALLEWGLTWRSWRPGERTSEASCFMLTRIGTSSVAYSLTGNLWLTALFQVGLALLMEDAEA